MADRVIKFRVFDGERMHGPVSAWDLHSLFSPMPLLDEGAYAGEVPPPRVMLHGAATDALEVTPIDTSRLTLMQYTGLKDADGVDIYEGDIIDADYGYGVVVWNDTTASFKYEFSLDSDDLWHYARGGRVVGNIYEHSELLETA